LVEVSIGREDDRVTFGPHDRHWNAVAHRVVAEELLRQMTGISGAAPAGPGR
jgi:virulence-associated protein VagC